VSNSKTELELLGSATDTPPMPRKRKSPAGFSSFGRASQAGKQGGPDNRPKGGKQIEAKQQQQAAPSQRRSGQNEVDCGAIGSWRCKVVEEIFCCMGNEGGDVVRHLMSELAAEGERADEAAHVSEPASRPPHWHAMMRM
jgi:hypothetical protein